jgi:uncharacterized protein (DUF488 family)
MNLYTIGFTQKNAQRFFSLLQGAGVKRVIDTRLNNRSQLAGFSKGDDLRYFLSAIGGMGYRHALEMAPTQEMLDRYKKEKGLWSDYVRDFLQLIESRQLAAGVSLGELDGACLLCSEHEPEHCHRRLVAEYLRSHFPAIEIVHLV